MTRTITIVTLLALTSMVSARNYSGSSYRYAPVVEVKPIYETYSVPERERVCERTRHRDDYYARSHRGGNTGGAVLGGIIGGVIGNQIGSGSGRDAATAVGIITGAAIGSNSPKRRHRHSNRHVDRHCYVQTEYRQEERVVAYEVAYEYLGEVYYTTLDHHPGERIKVKVNHTVAE